MISCEETGFHEKVLKIPKFGKNVFFFTIISEPSPLICLSSKFSLDTQKYLKKVI